VYDLTEFVDRHPGGAQILLCAAGKDATTHFSISHGPKEEAILRKHLVGELVGNDLPVFPPPDKFHKTVKAVRVMPTVIPSMPKLTALPFQRVNAYFTENNIDRKYSPTGLFHHLFVICALVILTWLQWRPWVCQSTLLFYAVAFLYGIAQVQASVTIVHDGSHVSLLSLKALAM
jgi:hypothetical protein